MTSTDILFERDETTALVTLNRPERRNALSLHMLEELTRCFREIGEDQELRVAILRANGAAFSAGHDLSEMVGREGGFYRELFEACTTLMETLQAIPQLPAGRVVRPGGRGSGGALRHSRREDRPVLLDPDGSAQPRRRVAQGDGDAAHRGGDLR